MSEDKKTTRRVVNGQYRCRVGHLMGRAIVVNGKTVCAEAVIISDPVATDLRCCEEPTFLVTEPPRLETR